VEQQGLKKMQCYRARERVAEKHESIVMLFDSKQAQILQQRSTEAQLSLRAALLGTVMTQKMFFFEVQGRLTFVLPLVLRALKAAYR